MTDHDTDTARVDAHRRLHNIGLPTHPDLMARVVAETVAKVQRDQAIAHLHKLLNSRRTATQAQEDERAAREWLESIGSEAP